jgi:hypothetical protein
MADYYSVGFCFTRIAQQRLVELTAKHKVSQARLIESILFGITDEAVDELLNRGGALRDAEKARIKALKKQARSVVERMTPEELQKLVAEPKPDAQ